MKDLTIEQRQEIEKAWNGKTGKESNIECKSFNPYRIWNEWYVCDPVWAWSSNDYRVKKQRRSFWQTWW